MTVEITHSGTEIEVLNTQKNPLIIEVALQRDGQNGKSAFEIAVLNGYTGTIEEWTIALLPTPDYDYALLYQIAKL